MKSSLSRINPSLARSVGWELVPAMILREPGMLPSPPRPVLDWEEGQCFDTA